MAHNLKTQHFSGSWKTDILEIMWFLLERSQVWWECFVIAAAAAVTGLLSAPFTSSLGRQLLFSHPRLPLWGALQPDGDRLRAGWREGKGRGGVNSTPETYSTVSRRSRRTHTSTLRLEVWSRVTPNLSHSGEVKRSGYLLWRGSLTYTQKYTERDRICPLSPHLSLNKLDCVSRAVCVVSGYKEL